MSDPRQRPLAADRRRFEVTVRNGIGDEAVVVVDASAHLKVTCYTGCAILQARRVIPDEKPWTVGPWVEIAGPAPAVKVPDLQPAPTCP